MTGRVDVERVLDAFLSPDADRVADRVIDTALDLIQTTSQERSLRIPWRLPTVNPAIRLAGAALVALLAVGVAAYALRPMASVGPPPTPTVQPSAPAPTPASTDRPWWLGGHDGCGACVGALPAGSHTSSYMQPGITYSVPSGWVNAYDTTDAFELVPDTAANQDAINGRNGTLYDLSVNRNLRLGSADCSTTPANESFTANSIVQGLASRAGVAASTPVNVTVGGLSGKQLDFAVGAGWTAACPGDVVPGVATFTNGEAHWWAVAGERKRVIVLDDPLGGNLVIEIASPEGGFAGHLAASMAIVNTFTFSEP